MSPAQAIMWRSMFLFYRRAFLPCLAPALLVWIMFDLSAYKHRDHFAGPVNPAPVSFRTYLLFAMLFQSVAANFAQMTDYRQQFLLPLSTRIWGGASLLTTAAGIAVANLVGLGCFSAGTGIELPWTTATLVSIYMFVWLHYLVWRLLPLYVADRTSDGVLGVRLERVAIVLLDGVARFALGMLPLIWWMSLSREFGSPTALELTCFIASTLFPVWLTIGEMDKQRTGGRQDTIEWLQRKADAEDAHESGSSLAIDRLEATGQARGTEQGSSTEQGRAGAIPQAAEPTSATSVKSRVPQDRLKAARWMLWERTRPMSFAIPVIILLCGIVMTWLMWSDDPTFYSGSSQARKLTFDTTLTLIVTMSIISGVVVGLVSASRLGRNNHPNVLHNFVRVQPLTERELTRAAVGLQLFDAVLAWGATIVSGMILLAIQYRQLEAYTIRAYDMLPGIEQVPAALIFSFVVIFGSSVLLSSLFWTSRRWLQVAVPVFVFGVPVLLWRLEGFSLRGTTPDTIAKVLAVGGILLWAVSLLQKLVGYRELIISATFPVIITYVEWQSDPYVFSLGLLIPILFCAMPLCFAPQAIRLGRHW